MVLLRGATFQFYLLLFIFCSAVDPTQGCSNTNWDATLGFLIKPCREQGFHTCTTCLFPFLSSLDEVSGAHPETCAEKAL
ncbi:hypothetical protein CYMTET_40617, partial [Cymbomonas tetramitiformis]